MSRQCFRINEAKILAATNHLPFIGKRVGLVAQHAQLTKPTVSRGVLKMINDNGLQFPIQLTYPCFDLRLVRLLFTVARSRLNQVLHITKVNPLINLQHLVGGFDETFLATFVLDLDGIAQLQRVLRQLKSWRWVIDFRLFLIRETLHSFNWDNYDFSEDAWRINWRVFNGFLTDSFEDPGLLFDYISNTPGAHSQGDNQSGNIIDFDHLDVDILNILHESRWRSFSDISKRIGVGQGALTKRINNLHDEGCFCTYTDFDESTIGLPHHNILFIESVDQALLQNLLAVFQLLPRSHVYRTDSGSHSGLIAEFDLPGTDSIILPTILMETFSKMDLRIGEFAWFNGDPNPHFTHKFQKALPSSEYLHTFD
ncbi:MAG: Lrp/AsnC family transcriptional regulator, partial [Candidatus Ranarchaeia archaeon]